MAEPMTPPTTPTKNPPHGAITSPSPLKAQHKTPPTSKTQTYHHEPDGKPRHKIETPGGSIKPIPKFPGASHQVGMRDNGSRYTEEDFDTALTFTEQWDCLLLALSNLRNRANKDFKRYERSFTFPYPAYDWGHHHYTRLAIECCLSKIKTCLNSTQTDVDVIDALNTSIQEGRIYNPFGLKAIYPTDCIYAYFTAQNIWFFTKPLYTAGFKYITPHTQAFPNMLAVHTAPIPPSIPSPIFSKAEEPPETHAEKLARLRQSALKSLGMTQKTPQSKKRCIEITDAKQREAELREKVTASFKHKKICIKPKEITEPTTATLTSSTK
jgi:hypothetical protein